MCSSDLKQNPDKLNYASQGNGSVSHIGTEIFKQQTGIQMTHVPYKGSGQAIQDVLAGQVQVFITTPPSVMGHVLNGKLKALAVTSSRYRPAGTSVPLSKQVPMPVNAWSRLIGVAVVEAPGR